MDSIVKRPECPECNMPLAANGGCYYPECPEPKLPNTSAITDQQIIQSLQADNAALREKLDFVREIASHAPELNMSNYDEDDVSELNQAMIQIYNYCEPRALLERNKP